MEKAKVSQDFLYEYLKQHDVVISVFYKRMGVSKGIVDACFRHDINRHGKPLYLSKANVTKINTALEQIAEELRRCVIVFGSPDTYTVNGGKIYDPGTLPAIQRMAEYFNMTKLTNRILGWNKGKKDGTISVRTSTTYGRVTADDVSRLNAEILAVSGMFAGIEVVAHSENDSSNC